MKVAWIFGAMAYIFAILYTYYLLQYIQADRFLWLLWVLDVVFTVLWATIKTAEDSA